MAGPSEEGRRCLKAGLITAGGPAPGPVAVRMSRMSGCPDVRIWPSFKGAVLGYRNH